MLGEAGTNVEEGSIPLGTLPGGAMTGDLLCTYCTSGKKGGEWRQSRERGGCRRGREWRWRGG